jgi:hypothetical protein
MGKGSIGMGSIGKGSMGKGSMDSMGKGSMGSMGKGSMGSMGSMGKGSMGSSTSAPLVYVYSYRHFISNTTGGDGKGDGTACEWAVVDRVMPSNGSLSDPRVIGWASHGE